MEVTAEGGVREEGEVVVVTDPGVRYNRTGLDASTLGS